MLRFNDHGLLPEGIHRVTLDEFYTLFGFNAKRQEMIDSGLVPFLREMRIHKIKEVYLDGSFVTTEENPNDIDGYVITESASDVCGFLVENKERWQEEFRIEIYPALTDYHEEEGSLEWAESLFVKLKGRPALKKGYVVLKLS